MDRRAKVGLAALAVVLALAIVPVCNAQVGFSHPRMDDLKIKVGESAEFEVAVYNEGSEPLQIRMKTENLDEITIFDPETATIPPDGILNVRVTFTPTEPGTYRGEILAVPVENDSASIPLTSAMGCRVKITATEEEKPPENVGPNPANQGKGLPLIPIIFAVGVTVAAIWLHRKKMLKLFGISLLILVLTAPIVVADEKSMDANTVVENPPNPPGPPTLQLPENGTHTSDNTPYFQWIGGSNATSHRIRVDNDSDFSSPEIDQSGLTENNYTPTTGLADGQYWWKVTAINEDGQADSDVWTFTVDTTPPSAPVLVSPENGENVQDKTPTLTWNAVSENSTPVLYYLAMSDNSEFPYENENSGWITGTEYTTSTLENGTVWYWRVRAKDNVGNTGEWSETRWFRVVIPNYAVAVLITPDTQDGIINEILTYTITVVNEGMASDNYTISFTQTMAWSASLEDNYLENVGPGENRTTKLRVTVESAGFNQITVTVTSQADGTVSSTDSCMAVCGDTGARSSENFTLLAVIAIIAGLATILTVLGLRWREIGFVVLGSIAWIIVSVMFLWVKLSFSTVPISLFFAGIGVVLFALVISEALREFRRSVR